VLGQQARHLVRLHLDDARPDQRVGEARRDVESLPTRRRSTNFVSKRFGARNRCQSRTSRPWL